MLNRVWRFTTLWTVAHQAPLFMGFSRQECWSGLPCPPPGDLPDPGIEPASPAVPALAGSFFLTSATWEACRHISSLEKTTATESMLGFPCFQYLSFRQKRDWLECLGLTMWLGQARELFCIHCTLKPLKCCPVSGPGEALPVFSSSHWFSFS